MTQPISRTLRSGGLDLIQRELPYIRESDQSEDIIGDDTPAALGARQLDEGKLKHHADEIVRSSVQETLNAPLDAESDQICGAQRYGRSLERVDGRAGHCERKLEIKAAAVTLRVPQLWRLPFDTAISKRYRRRECSAEDALVEMYLPGVSVQRVEDIAEALWGARANSGTVSRLNQEICRQIETCRNRQVIGEFPYLNLDGLVFKKSWADEARNKSVLVAIGVGTDGHRQNLGVADAKSKTGTLMWVSAPLGKSGSQRQTADHLGCRQRALWKPPPRCSRKPTGNVASVTSTATYSIICPTRG